MNIIDNLKNIRGWRTNQKLIAFAVDDYGNVRLGSPSAKPKLIQTEGANRFDLYDTLETNDDLLALFESLESVRDSQGNPAIFTPYALPCNIDFESMRKSQFASYEFEILTDTFNKLASYDPANYANTWNLWKEGIEKGLLEPQFHGREHFNLKLFNKKLQERERQLLDSLSNRSLVNLGNDKNNVIGWTQAFAFWDPVKDTEQFPEILATGLKAFERVFGFNATAFTPPAQQFPAHLISYLPKLGIRFFDRPFYQKKHLGFGKYKHIFSKTGYDSRSHLTTIVRNVVFEPTNGSIDHVSKALHQIEAAFRWKKPAIISSHRVNFCGYIDEKNRKTGIDALRQLLKKIVDRWPDVQFVSIAKLGSMIENSSKRV